MIKHKIFKISLQDPDAGTERMNAFCSQHAIESVDRQFVPNGDDSFWTFCLKWIDGNDQNVGKVPARRRRKSDAVDYQRYFDNPDDFALYDELRKLRNELSEKGSFPPYTIFTNEQLAQIVEQRINTKTELGELEGFGKTKMEKYADVFLEKINEVNLRLGKHGATES